VIKSAFAPAIVKKASIKKSKADHRLVTRVKHHYNAPAFTQRRFPNDHLGRSHAKQGSPTAGCAPDPWVMTNSVHEGRRLVLRVVILQLGCATLGALVFACVRGAAAAWAGLVGGLIVAIGSALFGWRLFAAGIAPATVVRRALFAAESLKWAWFMGGMWAALVLFKLQPLPLMTGLVFAQFGYWAGMVGLKRNS